MDCVEVVEKEGWILGKEIRKDGLKWRRGEK